MKISRRTFLAAAAGSTALAGIPDRLSGAIDAGGAGIVVVLDLDSPLRESLAGYETALSSRNIPFICRRPGTDAWPQCRVMIVPGCVTAPAPVAAELRRTVRAGSLLLLESGAGFASPAQVQAHRDFLHAEFGLRAGPVLDLWQRDASRSRVPYIDFRWPHDTKIRDFSRAVSLAAPSEQAIAFTGKHAVATRRRLGHGTLLFLGSPLGPALWAGEAEAHQWLAAVLAGA